jgi:hypothetical protein
MNEHSIIVFVMAVLTVDDQKSECDSGEMATSKSKRGDGYNNIIMMCEYALTVDCESAPRYVAVICTRAAESMPQRQCLPVGTVPVGKFVTYFIVYL